MTVLIPQVFHRFWAGPRPLPEQHRMWIDDCQRLHPGWLELLWPDIPSLPSGLQQVWHHANVVQKSDLAGYWLAYYAGGVYADTDYEWYRSIEPWIQDCSAFFVFANNRGQITASVFGGVAGHPAFAAILEALPKRFRADEQLSTSSRLLTPVVKARGDVRIFEHQTFLPLTWERRDETLTQEQIQYSVARHHFAGSWLNDGCKCDTLCDR